MSEYLYDRGGALGLRLCMICALGGTRTHDLNFCRDVLYPTELRGQPSFANHIDVICELTPDNTLLRGHLRTELRALLSSTGARHRVMTF